MKTEILIKIKGDVLIKWNTFHVHRLWVNTVKMPILIKEYTASMESQRKF